MGQKVSPIGFRTGIRLPWQSTWYASKADYGTFLVEDAKIRDYVDQKYNRQMPKGAVAKTEIVRTSNEVKVTLHSARPGIVIGPRGGEVDKFREELEMLTGRKLFGGDTASDSLAGVLKSEINLSALPRETPQTIRKLLGRCMVRDRKQRLHDIADARLEIEEALSGREEVSVAATAPPPEKRKQYYARPTSRGAHTQACG